MLFRSTNVLMLLAAATAEPCSSSQCEADLGDDVDTASLLATRKPMVVDVGHDDRVPALPKGVLEMPSLSSPGVTGPPLYRITASNPYDAGFQHGTMARERILGWFNTAGMTSLFDWIGVDPTNSSFHGKGRQVFEKLKADNAKEFPMAVSEMEGIAAGAGVTLDKIWASNMLLELDMSKGLQNITSAFLSPDHCSDVFAISEGGYANGFAHGHDEDETEMLRPWFYFASYTFNSTKGGNNTKFTSCAGMSYPGVVVGASPTWNEHGMWATQNAVHLAHLRQEGLASSFVQRRAVCDAHNMTEAIAGLTTGGWAAGAAMNLLDVRGRRMTNVEAWEDIYNVLEVTEAMGNYSHFNEYKHLDGKKLVGYRLDQPKENDGEDREARVNEFPPPRSAADIKVRLTDALVMRPNKFSKLKKTLATFVMNGSTGQLEISCCGVNATWSHSWNILEFF